MALPFPLSALRRRAGANTPTGVTSQFPWVVLVPVGDHQPPCTSCLLLLSPSG